MNDRMKQVFENFMKKAFPSIKTDELYYKQWQTRFKQGREWQKSDYGSRNILKSLLPEVYPNDFYAFFIREEKQTEDEKYEQQCSIVANILKVTDMGVLEALQVTINQRRQRIKEAIPENL